MDIFDVFNGDADGICALHQYRLHSPCPQAKLITGVKRDIKLLASIQDCFHSKINVFDISLDRNRDDIERLLDDKNSLFYVDHHYSGDIPVSNNFEAHIDPQAQTCTSLIINNLLEDRHVKWAIAGAFGDNLDETAEIKAQEAGLNEDEKIILKEIGMLLNYNGYGSQPKDLYFHPAELYRQVQPYEDPISFHARCSALKILRQGYTDDMERAQGYQPIIETANCRIYELPPESWARRVAGVFSNNLAREQVQKAHGLLTVNDDGSYRISVRAPLNNRCGADDLCRKFPTGGGRTAAAGINRLPAAMLDTFLKTFASHFSSHNA